MAFLAGAIVAVLCLLVVLLPFRTRKNRESYSPESFSLLSPQELLAQREKIYHEIETLQLDRELGNIDEKEYQERLMAYRLQAAATFRDQQQLEELDANLEKQIQALRSRKSSKK